MRSSSTKPWKCSSRLFSCQPPRFEFRPSKRMILAAKVTVPSMQAQHPASCPVIPVGSSCYYEHDLEHGQGPCGTATATLNFVQDRILAVRTAQSSLGTFLLPDFILGPTYARLPGTQYAIRRPEAGDWVLGNKSNVAVDALVLPLFARFIAILELELELDNAPPPGDTRPFASRVSIAASSAMPHSMNSGSEQRTPSQSRSKGPRDASVDSREATTTEKFPDFESSSSTYNPSPASHGRSASRPNGYTNGATAYYADNWRPRSQSTARGGKWTASLPGQAMRGHGRQKSINDTFREIRARGGSVSQNAHQVAGALRAPVSPRLIVCRLPPLPTCSSRVRVFGADIKT